MCPVGLARRRGAVGDPSSNPMPAPMYDSVSGPALAPGSNEPLRLSSFPYGDDPTTTAAVPPVGPGGEEPTTPTDSSAVAAVAPVGPGGKEPLRMSSTPTDPSTVAPGDSACHNQHPHMRCVPSKLDRSRWSLSKMASTDSPSCAACWHTGAGVTTCGAVTSTSAHDYLNFRG